MRNTSTDGDFFSLVTVWDCGIDGVETGLSSLSHTWRECCYLLLFPTELPESTEMDGRITSRPRRIEEGGQKRGKKKNSVNSKISSI